MTKEHKERMVELILEVAQYVKNDDGHAMGHILHDLREPDQASPGDEILQTLIKLVNKLKDLTYVTSGWMEYIIDVEDTLHSVKNDVTRLISAAKKERT